MAPSAEEAEALKLEREALAEAAAMQELIAQLQVGQQGQQRLCTGVEIPPALPERPFELFEVELAPGGGHGLRISAAPGGGCRVAAVAVPSSGAAWNDSRPVGDPRRLEPGTDILAVNGLRGSFAELSALLGELDGQALRLEILPAAPAQPEAEEDVFNGAALSAPGQDGGAAANRDGASDRLATPPVALPAIPPAKRQTLEEFIEGWPTPPPSAR